MKRFVITLAIILLISVSAFWFVSVPHPWQTDLFRYTVLGIFLGVAFMMALYHVFLYAFGEQERVYLLFAAACLTMLARFVTIEGGIASLLMTDYPQPLRRVSLSILTVHAVFGVLFIHEALRIPIGKPWGLIYGACYTVSFFGPYIFDRPFYLVVALVPNVLLVIRVLKSPAIHRNPYRLTMVISLIFFTVWTILGVTKLFDGLFIIGLFPWLFFFFSQTILLTVEFTETRQRELAMQEKNVLLESLSRVKFDFFSNINHEIKTPLTVIATDIALAQRYIKNGEYGKSTELLKNAHAEVMRTADFVTEALRFARDEETASAMKPFDFSAALRTTLVSFEPFARVRDNVIESRPAHGPLMVYGNADTIGNAVLNLLTNANNHTTGGTIQVVEDVSGGELRITVRDTGTGIPRELLPHVFKRGVTDGGGTGLGLAIAKSVIEQHGGRIEIESIEK